MKDIPLFDAWNIANPLQVYTLSDRQTVTAVSGVFLTTKPGVQEILEPVTIAGIDAVPGDLIYPLMYLGEGWIRGFFHGKVLDLSLDAGNRQVTRKLKEYESTWWVEIRTSTGVTGWTNQGFFSGQSESGGPVPYIVASNGRQNGDQQDYELEFYVPDDAKDVSIKIADTSIAVSLRGIQKIQTGPILRGGDTYRAELVADDGQRLLAKTFIRPDATRSGPATVPLLTTQPQQVAAKPSFNCQYANSPTEKLLCSNAQLAATEVQMVAAHDEVLSQLPNGRIPNFQKAHLDWFKDYTRTCNALAARGRSMISDHRSISRQF